MNYLNPHLVLEDNIPGCEFFKWKEVLFLPQWKIHLYPNAYECANLQKITIKLDWIRKYFNNAIKVTSGIRPEIYNRQINGALNSAHITGEALDFQVIGMDADLVRTHLKPMLEHLQIRMENKPYSNWTHIDLKPPGNSGRFFTP